ncbi:MAG: response regulator transcription factor [Dehalococcoidales bacterium]|nr:response regulator transcription factor [Dehalococcoidales bacterium]
MQNAKILIVDDEEYIINLLKETLESEEYQISIAMDGEEAIGVFKSESPDLMILDLILPKVDGIEVCRIVRKQSQVPILVLSALGEQEDKIKCLNLGVDDYLTKPFGMDELLARIRVLLRRKKTNSSFQAQHLVSGDLDIDFLANKVTLYGKEVCLTPIEYKLLTALAKNAGKFTGYNELLDKVWGLQYKDDKNILHRHISRLHK